MNIMVTLGDIVGLAFLALLLLGCGVYYLFLCWQEWRQARATRKRAEEKNRLFGERYKNPQPYDPNFGHTASTICDGKGCDGRCRIPKEWR